MQRRKKTKAFITGLTLQLLPANIEIPIFSAQNHGSDPIQSRKLV